MKTKSQKVNRTDVTDEQLAKGLTETQRELLLFAAKPGRGWCSLDVSGEGAGSHASAKALGRKGLLVCAHPGGPSWGEWNVTDRGRRVAALVRGVKPAKPVAESKPGADQSSRPVPASRIVEWGPYLGKDPGRAVAREAHDGVEVSMDGGATWPIWVPGWQVDRDVAMEAKRAAAYEPSTDYEGEDTRALDGAGAACKHPTDRIVVDVAAQRFVCVCGVKLAPLPPGFDVAAWSRANTPEPITLVMPPSIDALVRVTVAHDPGPPVGTEGRLYRVDADPPRYRLAHLGWAHDVEVIGPPRTPEQRANDIAITMPSDDEETAP